MSAVKYQRFNALLFPDQVLFLKREAGRFSENEVLRRQLGFALATLRVKDATFYYNGWTVEAAEARDTLADRFGYVLSCASGDKFIIRAGPYVLKLNGHRSSKLKEIQKFTEVLSRTEPLTDA